MRDAKFARRINGLAESVERMFNETAQRAESLLRPVLLQLVKDVQATGLPLVKVEESMGTTIFVFDGPYKGLDPRDLDLYDPEAHPEWKITAKRRRALERLLRFTRAFGQYETHYVLYDYFAFAPEVRP